MQSPDCLLQNTAPIAAGVLGTSGDMKEFLLIAVEYTNCECADGGITYGIGDEENHRPFLQMSIRYNKKQ